MPENLYVKDHRSGNKKFRDNYDRIFKKKKPEKRIKVTDNLVDQEIMVKGGATMWIHPDDIKRYEDRGWRRLA